MRTLEEIEAEMGKTTDMTRFAELLDEHYQVFMKSLNKLESSINIRSYEDNVPDSVDAFRHMVEAVNKQSKVVSLEEYRRLRK